MTIQIWNNVSPFSNSCPFPYELFLFPVKKPQFHMMSDLLNFRLILHVPQFPKLKLYNMYFTIVSFFISIRLLKFVNVSIQHLQPSEIMRKFLFIWVFHDLLLNSFIYLLNFHRSFSSLSIYSKQIPCAYVCASPSVNKRLHFLWANNRE